MSVFTKFAAFQDGLLLRVVGTTEQTKFQSSQFYKSELLPNGQIMLTPITDTEAELTLKSTVLKKSNDDGKEL